MAEYRPMRSPIERAVKPSGPPQGTSMHDLGLWPLTEDEKEALMPEEEPQDRTIDLALDPRPFRNRVDGTRWQDDGGDPDLLPLVPREGFEQDPNAYPCSLDPFPWKDRLSPSGRRYAENPVPRIPWTDMAFLPREGYAQDRAAYGLED